MNVTNVTASTQNIWEAIQQETMRNPEQKSVTATAGQSTAIADSDDPDEDGVATLLERIKAQKQKAAAASGGAEQAESGDEPAPAPQTVATSLENVGPNTFERIRSNAGNAYLTQAANHGGGDGSVLHKSA